MITRFAPSPTGPLHLGHAYSALCAFDRVHRVNGRFLLRIEDTDTQRAKPEWEALIYEDLAWLGLRWETPVRRQSEHLHHYERLITSLLERGLAYPCYCTRSDIKAALSAPQEGAMGPDGPIYPGTCRASSEPHPNKAAAIRLNMQAAMEKIGPVAGWIETGPDQTAPTELTPAQMIATVGDIVLGRKDTGTAAYHLAVVVDDALQGITHVVRGADLFEATIIHVVLQRLLGLPSPQYHHHVLIRDETGKRLAKRDDSKAIAKYRAEGATPDDIRAMVGL